jgi:hypothetical protein
MAADLSQMGHTRRPTTECLRDGSAACSTELNDAAMALALAPRTESKWKMVRPNLASEASAGPER